MVLLDLICRRFDGAPIPFRVEVQHHSLEHLIADALEAHRVYELMMIRRPGDVWKYLWVKALEVPPTVMREMASKREDEYPHGRCPWPENSMPLSLFDTFFYGCWADDTSPESECWLKERESSRFLEFGRQLFQRIQLAQQEIRETDDLLIRTELTAIDPLQHCHDMDAQPPFELTTPIYESPTVPKRTTAYYQKLRQLWAGPEVQSVSVRDDDDYQTLRLLCTEQRRRSSETGRPIGHDMPLHVLSDHFPSFARWGAKVLCWQEGLGYGDLMLDSSRSCDYAELLRRTRRQLLALTHRSGEDIKGYQRTSGEGWVLYRDVRPWFDYAEVSQSERLDFLRRFAQ
jgi:hypothetical protein